MIEIQNQIRKQIAQIRLAFLGVVAIGGQVLQLKGLSDELLQEVENIQQVGFASYVPVNSRVVVLPLAGRTGRSVCIATTGGNVIVTVNEGETCIYDQFGHKVLLTQTGIKMTGDVDIDGGLTVKNDIKSNGQVSDVLGSMQAMRDVYNAHSGHIGTGAAEPQMLGVPE